MEIRENTIDKLYQKAINEVIQNGKLVTARNLDFKEVIFQHLILENPRARIVQNKERKLSKRFMMGEFIWIMGGSPWLDQISFYNKNYSQFSDDGISLHGAYGPRLRHWSLQHGDVDQLNNCLQRLKNDIYTRQAVIVIIDPAIDFTEKTKDIPCNNYLQFLYRDGKLHLMCYVRSNDLYWGLPYDIFHWTMLQEMYATILGVEVGEYHHIIGSMHIYTKDIETMKKIASEKVLEVPNDIMPKLDDLSIIDKLKNAELKYRKERIVEVSNLPEYWQKHFKLIVK
jgi:thymidylate synthase